MEIKTAPHGGKHFQPRKDKKNVYSYEWLQEKQALDLHISIFKQYDLMSEIMPLEEYIDKFPCVFDRI